MQILGVGYNYVFLPASQTRGGILVAWLTTSWSVSNISMLHFSLGQDATHLSLLAMVAHHSLWAC
jgi:hypothetical protein